MENGPRITGAVFILRSREAEVSGTPMSPMVQFVEVDLAAQSIAVNAQKPRGAGLISIGTIENPFNEFFLELVHRFLKQNASLDHLSH